METVYDPKVTVSRDKFRVVLQQKPKHIFTLMMYRLTKKYLLETVFNVNPSSWYDLKFPVLSFICFLHKTTTPWFKSNFSYIYIHFLKSYSCTLVVSNWRLSLICNTCKPPLWRQQQLKVVTRGRHSITDPSSQPRTCMVPPGGSSVYTANSFSGVALDWGGPPGIHERAPTGQIVFHYMLSGKTYKVGSRPS